jgi:hypothetical protein
MTTVELPTPTEKSEELKINQVTLTFLYSSINDMQAVIRALDAKLSGLLVIFCIAINKLDLLHDAGQKFVSAHPRSGYLLVTTFFVAWLLGMLSAFLGLVAIDNPAAHIDCTNINGTFYSGRLFSPKLLDSFYNRRTRRRPKLDAHQTALPKTENDIFEELSFEQMKLAYIRSIKIRRARTAFFSLLAWFATGIICWAVTLKEM